jgi:hypothetical protein
MKRGLANAMSVSSNPDWITISLAEPISYDAEGLVIHPVGATPCLDAFSGEEIACTLPACPGTTATTYDCLSIDANTGVETTIPADPTTQVNVLRFTPPSNVADIKFHTYTLTKNDFFPAVAATDTTPAFVSLDQERHIEITYRCTWDEGYGQGVKTTMLVP